MNVMLFAIITFAFDHDLLNLAFEDNLTCGDVIIDYFNDTTRWYNFTFNQPTVAIYIDSFVGNVSHSTYLSFNDPDLASLRTGPAPLTIVSSRETLAKWYGNYRLGIHAYDADTYTISVNCHYLHFHDPLYCNSDISDQTNASHASNYHLFSLDHNATIMFDSCHSFYDTYLYLYNSHFELIDDCDDCGQCGQNAQLERSLTTGTYILRVSGFSTRYGSYHILVDCDHDGIHNTNDSITTRQPTSPIFTSTSYYTTVPPDDDGLFPILYLSIGLIGAQNEYMYVSSTGFDNDECGSSYNPCGSIVHAIAHSANIYDVQLYVTGQFFHCLNYFHLPNAIRSLTITFDIDSVTDWFPDYCSRSINIHISNMTQMVIFNNLVINNIETINISRYETTALILNNCSFYNISKFGIYSALPPYQQINQSYISFNEVLFSNMSMNIYGAYVQMRNTDFRQIKGLTYARTILTISTPDDTSLDLRFQMENCSVVDATDYDTFILFSGQNIHSNIRLLSIHNTSFIDVDSYKTLIKSSAFLETATVAIYIESCGFLYINAGAILVAKGSHSITMKDVSITTDQSVQNVEYDDLLSLFLFDTNVNADIMNITLKYLNQLRGCVLGFKPGYSPVGDMYTYVCHDPIQLMTSRGVTHVDTFVVSNDIQYDTKYTHYPKCSSGYNYCEFYFNSILYDGDYGLIHNYGELTIHNFEIQGTGIYSQLIKNKGFVLINNTQSRYDYYHDEFDPYTLNIHTYFRNDGDVLCGGSLRIHNSYIYGTSLYAIISSGRELFVQDTLIKRCKLALYTLPQSTSLYVDNVQFIQVGAWYFSMSAILLSDEIGPAIFVTSQHSIIKNSYFSFYDAWGFIVSSVELFTALLFGSLDYTNNTYHTALINNTFELTTDGGIFTVDWLLGAVELYRRITGVTDVRSAWSLSFGGQQSIKTYLSRFNTFDIAFLLNGLLTFDKFSTAELIGNTFHGNDALLQNLTSIDIPFIYIDNNNVNCMSSNTISGYALHLVSGNVTSCHRPSLIDIIHNSVGCWDGGLGLLDDTYTQTDTMDQFIATDNNIAYNIPLISIVSPQSVYAAENISFSLNTTNEIRPDEYVLMNLTSGTVLLFDMIFDENMDIYGSNCAVNCHQMINNTLNPQGIYQFYGVCGDTALNESSSILNGRSGFKTHNSPHLIELTYDKEYYPGARLYIDHIIVDIHNNTITDYSHEITVKLFAEELSIDLEISIDGNGNCLKCKQGIYFQTIDIEDVGTNFTIATSVHNNELQINDIQFDVIGCPVMFGKTSASSQQCELCGTGYLSLQSTIDECIRCADIINFKEESMSCAGKNDITVNHNYWVNIDIRDDGNNTIYSMISSACPPNMCCQNTNGCNYIHSESSCIEGRDSNSYLCSKCKDKLSEMIGTVKCGTCDKNSVEMILILLGISVIITAFFIFESSKVIDTHHDATRTTTNIYDDKYENKESFVLVMKTMVLKPLLLYFQAVSYIITHSEGVSVSTSIASFVEIFNFSVDTVSSESSGYCLLKNMNALNKILASLSISVGSVLLLIIFYVLSLAVHIKYTKREPRLLKAFTTVLLMCIGKILQVIFKILSCKNIGNDINIHFYFAYSECYDISWWLSLVSLSIIVGIFAIFFTSLYKMDPHYRYSPDCHLVSFTKSYCDRYWYFEFFILFRRIILALLIVISYSDQQYADLVVIVFLAICVCINERLQPFIHRYVNTMETICLCNLIFIIFIKNTTISNDIITLFILLPLFVLTLFMFLYRKCPSQRPLQVTLELEMEQIEIETEMAQNELEPAAHVDEDSSELDDMSALVEQVIDQMDEECDDEIHNNGHTNNEADVEMMDTNIHIVCNEQEQHGQIEANEQSPAIQ
eukprot:932563_1